MIFNPSVDEVMQDLLMGDMLLLKCADPSNLLFDSASLWMA